MCVCSQQLGLFFSSIDSPTLDFSGDLWGFFSNLISLDFNYAMPSIFSPLMLYILLGIIGLVMLIMFFVFMCLSCGGSPDAIRYGFVCVCV